MPATPFCGRPKALATLPEDLPDGSAELFSQQIADYDAETQHQREAGLLSRDALTTRLQVQAVLRRWGRRTAPRQRRRDPGGL